MQKVYLNSEILPVMVKEGKLTIRQAVNQLAENLLKNPENFGLFKKDDDKLSEIIYSLLSNGEALFTNYNENICKFSTYIQNFIKYRELTLSRENFRSTLKEKATSYLKIDDYQDTENNYTEQEYSYQISHLKPYKLKATDKAPYASKRIKKPQFVESNKKFPEPKNVNEKIALIIALKSAWYLTEKQMKAISEFCKIDINLLNETLSELKKSIEHKVKNIEGMKSKRNHEYYLHKKYYEEVQYCIEHNRDHAEADRLLDLHTKQWKERNKKILEKSARLSPSNKKIAEVLGICERKVSYYIKKADQLKGTVYNDESEE